MRSPEKTLPNTPSSDPIAHDPAKEAFAVNGVSAIQYYGKDQLLVVERSTHRNASLHNKSIFV
jgi:hypothetical protein